MRRGKEENIHSLIAQLGEVERLQWEAAITGDMRVNLVKAGWSGAFTRTRKENGLFHARMAIEKACELKARISCGAYHSGLDLRGHQARMPSRRFCSSLALRLFAAMIRMVSSPATVPTTSSQPSASTATATGWALPGTVFTTRRF